MSTTREEVYKAIDSERDYQEQRWPVENIPGGPASRQHSIEEWVFYMYTYMREASELLTRYGTGTPQYLKALDCIRKITALGVVCMEQHGAPHRQ